MLNGCPLIQPKLAYEAKQREFHELSLFRDFKKKFGGNCGNVENTFRRFRDKNR